jgi:hypothetical protein
VSNMLQLVAISKKDVLVWAKRQAKESLAKILQTAVWSLFKSNLDLSLGKELNSTNGSLWIVQVQPSAGQCALVLHQGFFALVGWT